ncbi:MAG TPA: hypothetical protein VIK97_04845, partial [Casimicrobiaceae bacterium]
MIGAALLAPIVACDSHSATPSPSDGDTATLPQSAQAQIEALLAEKAARTPAQRKISSQLLYQQRGTFAAFTDNIKDPAKRITPLAQTDGHGRVLVDIKGQVVRGRIDALG